MGLDVDNAQHSSLILEALHDIADVEKFLEYCRSHKDGVQYMNRVEKLDTLATRYKKEENDIPKELLEKFCKNLAAKFKEAISVLRANEEYLTDLHKLKADGEQYFTDKEISLLDDTGKLNRLISLYELGTLYGALYDKSVKKVLIGRTKPELANKEALRLANSIRSK